MDYNDLTEEGKEQYNAQLHFRYQTTGFDLKWERSKDGTTYSHAPELYIARYYPRGLYKIHPCYDKGEYKLSRAMVVNGKIGYFRLHDWIKGQKRAKELAQEDLDERYRNWKAACETPEFSRWREKVLGELGKNYSKLSAEETAALAAEKEKAEQEQRLKAALEESKRLENEFASWLKIDDTLDFGF